MVIQTVHSDLIASLHDLRQTNTELIDLYLKEGNSKRGNECIYQVISINNELDLLTKNREN